MSDENGIRLEGYHRGGRSLTKFIVALALVAFFLLVYLLIQAHISRAGEPPGLFDGQLQPCPGPPNCLCSEYPGDSSHYVAPLDYADLTAADAMQLLKDVIADLGGKVEIDYGDYLAATFTSDLMGFADDVELRVDHQANRIHIRSESRVGYGDFGANRDRVERIKSRFREKT